jgi:hypothetical protein
MLHGLQRISSIELMPSCGIQPFSAAGCLPDFPFPEQKPPARIFLLPFKKKPFPFPLSGLDFPATGPDEAKDDGIAMHMSN